MENNKPLLFDKTNYKLMLIGIAVIILGFALMSGTTDIMDTRKIAIAPVVVLIGFGIEFFAILHQPKKK
jgi:hypothetical protein